MLIILHKMTACSLMGDFWKVTSACTVFGLHAISYHQTIAPDSVKPHFTG